MNSHFVHFFGDEFEHCVGNNNPEYTIRGGTIGPKINFLKVPKWILLWFQYIRSGKKEFLDLESILTLHIGPEFSHFWPKIAEKWPLGENAVAEYCQTF